MRIVLLFLFCQLFTFLEAQDSTRRLIFLEAGGTGGYGSLNIEGQLLIKPRMTFLARLGISTYKLRDFERKFNPDLILPLTFSFLYGRKHQLELGSGLAFSSFPVLKQLEKRREALFSMHAVLAYRYTGAAGFTYKLAFTPLFENHKPFRPWFGLSIGKIL